MPTQRGGGLKLGFDRLSREAVEEIRAEEEQARRRSNEKDPNTGRCERESRTSPIARFGADPTTDRILDRLQLLPGHDFVGEQRLHQFLDESGEKMELGSLRRLILAV
jgi:hypothetical protein